MKRIFTLVIIFCIHVSAFLEKPINSLIINPGFEESAINTWRIYSPSAESRIFHNFNDTYKGWPVARAKNGEGRLGIVLGKNINAYKNYLQSELIVELKKDEVYHFEFSIAHNQSSEYILEEIDLVFSQNRVITSEELQNNIHTVTPEVRLIHDNGWLKLCGSYKAKGGEKYIALGNLNGRKPIGLYELDDNYRYQKPSNNPFSDLAYYYFDDFSLFHEKNDSSGAFNCYRRVYDTSIKKNLILLFDISGSMNVEKNRIVSNILELSKSIPNKDISLSVLLMGSSQKVILENVNLNQTELIQNKLEQSISSYGESNLGSEYYIANELAKRYHTSTKKSEIFVMSDGLIEIDPLVFGVIKSTKISHPDIKTHTIRYGSDDGPLVGINRFFGNDPKTTLGKIASASGGNYYEGSILGIKTILENQFSSFSEVENCSSNSHVCEKILAIDTTETYKYEYNITTLLLDVSSSMNHKDKLPYLKRTFLSLADSMKDQDKVEIISFSNKAKVELALTSYQEKDIVNNTFRKLKPKQLTNLYDGLNLAIKQAKQNYNRDYNNRIILATDGKIDFDSKLLKISKQAKDSDIKISVLHFSDEESEELKKISKTSNGSYHLIDSHNLLNEFSYEVKVERKYEPKIANMHFVKYTQSKRIFAQPEKDEFILD